MSTFLVERYLPGADRDQLDRIVGQLAQARFAPGVHYRGSVIVPGDEACLCLFDADDADTLRDANLALGLPVARVCAAVFVTHGT
jgi:hypothetical protein